jgi:hypothetical protein
VPALAAERPPTVSVPAEKKAASASRSKFATGGTREAGATRTIASLIGSVGLQVYDAGQWLKAKHGAKSRRTWRKLHLAVDAASCMIVAQTLIDQDVDDPSQVVSLPDQIEGETAKVMADGAYDGAPTYETSRHMVTISKWSFRHARRRRPAAQRVRPRSAISKWRW